MTTPAELARWIREEHDKVEDLANTLTEHVSVIPRTDIEGWLKTLIGQFEHFRAHFEKHMALEEEGGYLAVVLEQRPILQKRVHQLQAEHGAISDLMRSIMASLPTLKPDSRLLLRDVCCRIDNLMTVINEHEDHENLLVNYVFSQDVGTKD